MASFTSLSFLFRFIPIFMAVYFLAPAKVKNIVLLAGSIVFYAVGEPLYIFLLIALVLFNYLFMRLLYGSKGPGRYSENAKKRRLYMIIAVSVNILVLMTAKILNWTQDNFLLPIGLSFYIFKMISFQADVYKKEIPIRPGFIETATYFMAFPQIAQGPIMRYEDGCFYNDKRCTIKNIEDGLKYFILGLSMKVLLADRIGILWNDIGMYGFDSVSSTLAWMGAFAYSAELYFDFFGYSLMASGIMLAMGFDFIENFDNPYASKTISEFYRRWHMTLGNFFRDYVYIPLGGNREGKLRTVLNLAFVWFLTGLWHGNGFNFIIWGLVLGAFIILEKLFYGKKLARSKVLGHIYVLVVIPVTWCIFAIGDLKALGVYLVKLIPFVSDLGNPNVNPLDFVDYIKDYWYLFLIAAVLMVPAVTGLYEKIKKKWFVNVLLVVLFMLSVYFCASASSNPFMYLKF